MPFSYRLTKYDPRKRDANGAYTGDEWTSVWDIGHTIGGQTLSAASYLATETAYVEAARTLLSAAQIGSMRLTNLVLVPPDVRNAFDDTVRETCSKLKEGQRVSRARVPNIIRGCLRFYIGCRLWGRAGSYVHVGDDFYVYIGLPKPAGSVSLPRGMFLEECDSPYMPLYD